LSALPRGLWRKIEHEIIDERRRSFTPTSEPWNLSDIFYKLRTKMGQMGHNTGEITSKRNEIHSEVKDYCDKLGIKRHEIGIFPADRAILAFKGKFYSVGYEDIDELAENGPDIICVEKMGIIKKIMPYLDKFGVAFLQSQGFMAEYGQMLADNVEANVAVLTDFDSSGINLGFDLDRAYRIGIDFDTISEINQILESESKEQIDPSQLSEPYGGGANYYDFLQYLFEERWEHEKLNNPKNKKRNLGKKPSWWNTLNHQWYTRYLGRKYDGQSYLDIIANTRIELDSLMNAVGPKIFSTWLRNKILKTFPERDYTRAVDVPDYILTPTIDEFLLRLGKILVKMFELYRQDELMSLTHFKHLIDVKKKENKIKNQMTSSLLNSIDMLYFDSALRDFMDQHL
jgi:hypothetical protein